MDLISVIFVLLLVGFGLYALRRWGTMIDGTIKNIIYIVVIVCVLIWLWHIFVGPLPSIPIGRR